MSICYAGLGSGHYAKLDGKRNLPNPSFNFDRNTYFPYRLQPNLYQKDKTCRSDNRHCKKGQPQHQGAILSGPRGVPAELKPHINHLGQN